MHKYVEPKAIIMPLFQLKKMYTYTLKKSMTSGDNGEAPEPMKRTRPPSFTFILLNTSLSQIGDALLPEEFKMGK